MAPLRYMTDRSSDTNSALPKYLMESASVASPRALGQARILAAFSITVTTSVMQCVKTQSNRESFFPPNRGFAKLGQCCGSVIVKILRPTAAGRLCHHLAYLFQNLTLLTYM